MGLSHLGRESIVTSVLRKPCDPCERFSRSFKLSPSNRSTLTHAFLFRPQVITDRETRQSKGYGFVQFETVVIAQAAIQGMHGTIIEGRDLVVKVAGSSGPGGPPRGPPGGMGGPPPGMMGGPPPGYGAPPPWGAPPPYGAPYGMPPPGYGGYPPPGYGPPPGMYGAPPPEMYGAPPPGMYGAPPPMGYAQPPPPGAVAPWGVDPMGSAMPYGQPPPPGAGAIPGQPAPPMPPVEAAPPPPSGAPPPPAAPPGGGGLESQYEQFMQDMQT